MVMLKQQKGVVLVVALIFLTALTSVAVLLVSNSTSFMTLAGASEERTIAIQEAVSGVDKAIALQADGNDEFERKSYPEEGIAVAVGEMVDSAIVTRTTENNIPVPCSNSHLPSSDSKCNVLTLTVTNTYGRRDSVITVQSTIEQELP